MLLVVEFSCSCRSLLLFSFVLFFLDATTAGGSSTPSSSTGGRPLLVGGVLFNPPPRRGILPPVSRAAAAAAARAPPAAARAPSRSPADGSRPIGPAARTARHVVGAAAAAAGPAAAAVAAAPAASCTDEWSDGRQTLKLAGEKPYDCPMLGLTEEDVRFLKALVPSTVKSCFVLRLTFMQQDPVVRARAIAVVAPGGEQLGGHEPPRQGIRHSASHQEAAEATARSGPGGG